MILLASSVPSVISKFSFGIFFGDFRSESVLFFFRSSAGFFPVILDLIPVILDLIPVFFSGILDLLSVFFPVILDLIPMLFR